MIHFPRSVEKELKSLDYLAKSTVNIISKVQTVFTNGYFTAQGEKDILQVIKAIRENGDAQSIEFFVKITHDNGKETII